MSIYRRMLGRELPCTLRQLLAIEPWCWQQGYGPGEIFLSQGEQLAFYSTRSSGPARSPDVETHLAKLSDRTLACAAEQFPFFRFVIEQRLPPKTGGGWKRTEY